MRGLRGAAALALACAALLPVPAARPAEPPQGRCKDDSLVPAAKNLKRVRSATLCLINRVRSARGVAAVRSSAELGIAAGRFSRDMVRRRFFDHTSPSGKTPRDRIAATGYRAGATGENIAWGTGSSATPAAIVNGWVHSPGHLRNMLDPNYREIGVGVAVGAPVKLRFRAPAATYTTDFAQRRR